MTIQVGIIINPPPSQLVSRNDNGITFTRIFKTLVSFISIKRSDYAKNKKQNPVMLIAAPTAISKQPGPPLLVLFSPIQKIPPPTKIIITPKIFIKNKL